MKSIFFYNVSIKVIQISEVIGSVFLLALVSAEPDLHLVFLTDLIVFDSSLDIVFKKLCCDNLKTDAFFPLRGFLFSFVRRQRVLAVQDQDGTLIPVLRLTRSHFQSIRRPGALSLVAADFNSCPSSLLVCGKGSSISTLPKAPGTKAGIGGMGDGVGSSQE